MPPPASNAQRQRTREDEDVKVPKDPFVERQKREQQGRNGPIESRSDEVKIPKDPFMERQKQQQQQRDEINQQSNPDARARQEVKVPLDPFANRQRKEGQGPPNRSDNMPQSNKTWDSHRQNEPTPRQEMPWDNNPNQRQSKSSDSEQRSNDVSNPYTPLSPETQRSPPSSSSASAWCRA